MFKLNCTVESAPFILYYDTKSNDVYDEHFKALISAPKTITNHPVLSNKVGCLNIVLGTNCNMDCSFCSVKKERFANASPSSVEAFVQKLKSGNVQTKFVTFWGGEPLVYWKTLLELTPALVELCPEVQFSIITNGFLLTKEKTEWLLKNNFTQINVSLEPRGSTARGSVNLLDVIGLSKILRNLAEKRVLAVSYTPTPGYTDVIKAYDEFKQSIGCDFPMYVNPLKCRTFIERYSEVDCLKLRESVRECLVSEKIELRRAKRAYEYFSKSLVSKPSFLANSHCSMLTDAVTTDISGSLSACHTSNIRIGSIEKAAERMRVFSKWETRPKCKKCHLLRVCEGLCASLPDGESFESSCHNWRAMYEGVFQAVFKRMFNVDVLSVEACACARNLA